MAKAKEISTGGGIGEKGAQGKESMLWALIKGTLNTSHRGSGGTKIKGGDDEKKR